MTDANDHSQTTADLMRQWADHPLTEERDSWHYPVRFRVRADGKRSRWAGEIEIFDSLLVVRGRMVSDTQTHAGASIGHLLFGVIGGFVGSLVGSVVARAFSNELRPMSFAMDPKATQARFWERERRFIFDVNPGHTIEVVPQSRRDYPELFDRLRSVFGSDFAPFKRSETVDAAAKIGRALIYIGGSVTLAWIAYLIYSAGTGRRE